MVFGETQEMTGTQHVLARRAVDAEVSEAIHAMIGRQELRMRAAGIDSRFMSKGNVEGGLTTIEEKSLGAIRKGGTRPIQGVLGTGREGFDYPSTSPGPLCPRSRGWWPLGLRSSRSRRGGAPRRATRSPPC